MAYRHPALGLLQRPLLRLNPRLDVAGHDRDGQLGLGRPRLVLGQLAGLRKGNR